jgi:hypothetical protein
VIKDVDANQAREKFAIPAVRDLGEFHDFIIETRYR